MSSAVVISVHLWSKVLNSKLLFQCLFLMQFYYKLHFKCFSFSFAFYKFPLSNFPTFIFHGKRVCRLQILHFVISVSCRVQSLPCDMPKWVTDVWHPSLTFKYWMEQLPIITLFLGGGASLLTYK